MLVIKGFHVDCGFNAVVIADALLQSGGDGVPFADAQCAVQTDMEGEFLMGYVVVYVEMVGLKLVLADVFRLERDFVYQFLRGLFPQYFRDGLFGYFIGCVEKEDGDGDAECAVYPPETVGEEDAGEHDHRRQCIGAVVPPIGLDADVAAFFAEVEGVLCHPFFHEDGKINQ